jgi:hypothetical protein
MHTFQIEVTQGDGRTHEAWVTHPMVETVEDLAVYVSVNYGTDATFTTQGVEVNA